MWTDPQAPQQRRQVDPQRTGAKTPQETRVLLAHIMNSSDTNLYGTVHGGVVMKIVDDAAAAAAARHAGGPAVTVSVDGMTFINPAQVGDLLRADAVVASVGRTSIDTYVEVTAQRWNAPGADRAIVQAFLTFVAIDADGAPRQVPELLLGTPEDVALDARARERRTRRTT